MPPGVRRRGGVEGQERQEKQSLGGSSGRIPIRESARPRRTTLPIAPIAALKISAHAAELSSMLGGAYWHSCWSIEKPSIHQYILATSAGGSLPT